MSYVKGRSSREQILIAGAAVLLAKGFSATTTADLTQAAQISAGKLTHHFPSKAGLLEGAFALMKQRFEAGPLKCLTDPTVPPRDRVRNFFDEMFRFYAEQTGLVGCPLGHAAGEAEGVPPASRRQAVLAIEQITALLEKAFRDLDATPSLARRRAALFVDAWQGSIVVARAGGGLDHIRRSFQTLKESV